MIISIIWLFSAEKAARSSAKIARFFRLRCLRPSAFFPLFRRVPLRRLAAPSRTSAACLAARSFCPVRFARRRPCPPALLPPRSLPLFLLLLNCRARARINIRDRATLREKRHAAVRAWRPQGKSHRPSVLRAVGRRPRPSAPLCLNAPLTRRSRPRLAAAQRKKGREPRFAVRLPAFLRCHFLLRPFFDFGPF